MPIQPIPVAEHDDCDVPVVIHGRPAFAQRHPARVGNVVYAADTDTDCDGPGGYDAGDLLAAELGLRDAVGHANRRAAYIRLDDVRAFFRLSNGHR